jgi:hypothetical protein
VQLLRYVELAGAGSDGDLPGDVIEGEVGVFAGFEAEESEWVSMASKHDRSE